MGKRIEKDRRDSDKEIKLEFHFELIDRLMKKKMKAGLLEIISLGKIFD